MTEPENHTLALLREMRAEQQARENRLLFAVADSETRMAAKIDALLKGVDAMHLNGIKALKGFIGHRSMVERPIGSFEVDVSESKRQMADLQNSVGF